MKTFSDKSVESIPQERILKLSAKNKEVVLSRREIVRNFPIGFFKNLIVSYFNEKSQENKSF